MRLRHADGQLVHLSYGTNVHPAEDLPGIVAQFDRYALPVRNRLGVDRLGLGLWLAAPVARRLAENPYLRHRLRQELDARELEVVTLNGFPYQSFHAPVVKHAVYRPDWTDPRRLEYTLDLARILVELLPDDAARGSISTLPLGWREPWNRGAAAIASRALDDLARNLAALAGSSGRTIRVAFEPEPGCAIETTAEAVAVLSGVDTAYLGVCLDLAHLACAWEHPTAAVLRLRAAKLPVVKVQVSAALAVADPVSAQRVLRDYAEPRFLHQTRTAAGIAFDDLHEAIAAGAEGPWRIHYHVPLHAPPAHPLESTEDIWRAGLRALVAGPSAICDHFEVETYTWQVLPLSQRPEGIAGLVAGIAAEVGQTHAALAGLGLTPLSTVERR